MSDGGFRIGERRPAEDALVYRLWVAQGAQCFHCGLPMTGRGTGDLRWSREHLYPRSRHGNTPNSIVLAHRLCNTQRGNREPTTDELTRASSIYATLGMAAFQTANLPPTFFRLGDIWPESR